MKNLKKYFAICMALVLLLSCIPAVSAAEVNDATINEEAKASLTIWKYDWTNAYKDGVWNEDSFISTGWRESYVEEVLGEGIRKGDVNGETDNPLGNGQNSNGYALKGVEFTILKVADIVTFSESADDQHPDYNLTQVLYGFHKENAADLLAAIGLADGAGRYENADGMAERDFIIELDAGNSSDDYWYYQSDVLNKALSDALDANATTVKDALERYIKASEGAIVMNKTNENGKTIQRDLDLGLWLCVETAVPEMVTSTTNPFFVSLPMTTVSGDANSASMEGGHGWNYNVVVYPKNNTGIPSLEKTVRESVRSTGTNTDSDSITDGFDHNATASAGDILEYQIISTLPTITSNATNLTTYAFIDSIAEGISYNKTLKDVKIEFFTDERCTDKVAAWVQNDGRFTVEYSSDDRGMCIAITEEGLNEINGAAENVNGELFSSYSGYTLRLTYSATVNSDASFVYGDNGNCNEVILVWHRTSAEYYDTLIDDCHVYSFGLDLTKLFSDIDSESAADADMFKHVKFKLRNSTDNYYVSATRDEATGIYYVTGHVTEEADATIFYPVTVGGQFGHIVIKGLEDDCYNLYEVETANGYTLLKDEIYVDIYVEEDDDRLCNIYSKDILGVLQNDSRYSFDGGFDLALANIPQKYLEHTYLTAHAEVDFNGITMTADGESDNAIVPLTVVKTRGFDLPQTGDSSAWLLSAAGVAMMASALCIILLTVRKKDEEMTARQ